MAFSLAALGAGIGQFAQQYQQQQEMQKQTMMLQMQLARFKQEQEQLGREREAASGLWAAGLGGGLGGGTQQAPIQGLPQIGGGSQGWPSGGAPAGGGMVPGGALTKRGGVTLGEAKAAALRAGFDEHGANIITAITVPESSLNPYAHNPRYPDDSYGLTQINARAHGPVAKEAWGNIDRAMELAYKVSGGGTNFSPWTTYTSGAYKPYLAEAAKIQMAARPTALPGNGASAGMATDIAAGTGQFAMPTNAAAGLGAPRPAVGGGGAVTDLTIPPPRAADYSAAQGPAGALPASITMRGQGRDAVLVNADTGEPIQSAPGGTITVPPATPTDYSRPPPAVAPPPGAAPRPTSSLTGTGAVQPGGTQVAQADPTRLLDQQATTGMQGAAKGLDPLLMGRLSTQALMQRIDKAMPNADPLAKMMALEKAQKMLAPDQQVQFQLWKMQHQEELRAALAKFQQDQINQRNQERISQQEKMYEQRTRDQEQAYERRLKDAQGTIIETDQGPMRLQPGSNKAVPIDLGGAKTLKSSAIGKPTLLEIKKEDGTTQRVEAQQQADGQWVTADERRVPIDTSLGYTALPPGGGTGRQGEQQAARITSAANLLSFELGNMMSLPAMSTASIFQGVESTPGRHLGESLKRTFAAKLTPETATDLATSYQGISRAVAALESGGAATGLVGLTKASEVYMPQPTDTVGNVWRKFATLRGVLERSLEAAASAKDVTPERKKLYEQIKEEVRANIPWTVEEVTKLTSGNVQTYKQLFEKTQKSKEQKAGGGGASPTSSSATGPAITGPPPEAIQMLRQDASPARRQQFDSVFGQGAADRALGSAVPPASGPEFSAPIPPPQ